MTDVLNNGDGPPVEGDGVALQSVSHPILVTDEMVEAGRRVMQVAAYFEPATMLRDVYVAMTNAAPYEDFEIEEGALVEQDVNIEPGSGYILYRGSRGELNELCRVKDDCISELRIAIKAARAQIVTLGGDASDEHGDAIQRGILRIIDEALAVPAVPGEKT